MKIDVYSDNKLSSGKIANIILFINSAFDHSFLDLGKAKYRFLGTKGNQLMAHAALAERSLSINNKRYSVLFLGQACILEELRNKGYGKEMIVSTRFKIPTNPYYFPKSVPGLN